MKKYIYALFYDDFPSAQCLQDGPEEIPFYIGITGNPEARLRQHRTESRKGHEDKYRFIRELEKQGKEWDLEVLHEIGEGDTRPWEYWYVIECIRQGISLKNMRYGNLHTMTETRLKKLAGDRLITSVDTLGKRLAEQPKGNGYSSSETVQIRAFRRSLRYLRSEMDKTSPIEKWNIFDAGEGTEEIRAERGVTIGEVAQLSIPATQEMFERLKRQAEIV